MTDEQFAEMMWMLEQILRAQYGQPGPEIVRSNAPPARETPRTRPDPIP